MFTHRIAYITFLGGWDIWILLQTKKDRLTTFIVELSKGLILDVKVKSSSNSKLKSLPLHNV